MTKAAEDDERSLATRIAADIRGMLISGEFAAAEKLSEQQMASRFGISRNTLREVFRLLTSQGLLDYIPNRGVFVAAPGEAAVVDIYRARRIIQKGAVEAASRDHPAIARMRATVAEAEAARAEGDWRRVGTTNMEFHRAMVDLCDSPRLAAAFDLLLAELRLVFGQLEDTSQLHEPYIALNAALTELLERGALSRAVSELDAYLVKSQHSVLAALRRRG